MLLEEVAQHITESGFDFLVLAYTGQVDGFHGNDYFVGAYMNLDVDINLGGIIGVVFGAILAAVIGFALYDPSKRAVFSIPVTVFIGCAIGGNTIWAKVFPKNNE